MKAAGESALPRAEAAGPIIVTCAMFLEDHAAFLDGLLSDMEAAAHEAHMRVCAACARYARVLKRGLALVRELPEIEPSAHFEQRLQHRIFELEDAAREERTTGRSATGLAAAALLALIAWSPLLLPVLSADADAGSANLAQAETQTLQPETTIRQDWYIEPVAPELDRTSVHRLVGHAGSFSPLIVSPPAYARGPRAVRLVSATAQ
jgi:hypothetical protein